MTLQDWIAVMGVAISALVAFGPWLLAVHAKLAVIASQMESIASRLERLGTAHEERLQLCMEHQSRLEAQAVQIADLAERI